MPAKISFLSLNKGFGGAEKMFRYLVSSYIEKHPSDVSRLIEVDLKETSACKVIRIIWSLRGSLVLWNCSVLGIHWYYLLVARIFGIQIALYPHLVVDHHLLGSRFAKIRNIQMTTSIWLANHVLSISEGNDERIRKIYRHTKVIPVRNFVESENTQPFEGRLNYRRIAVIGRIQEKHKGQVTLLKVLAPILGAKDLSIDFFGSGPDEDALKDCIESLNIGNHCVMHGWKNEAEIYGHDFGIVLNYSRWEGLSLGLLEAVFHNRIVLGNDIPGNRELLAPNRLFRSEDELIELLDELQQTPAENLVHEANEKKRVLQWKYSKNRSLNTLHEFVVSR